MNAPRLRFKEFSGEWEELTLTSFGNFKNGINKSKEDFGFGYPFINLMDVFGKSSINPSIKNEVFGLVNASNNELRTYNLLKGDVLFIRSSVKPEGVGETSVILEDLANTVYSGFLIRFRENQKKLDLLYKKYCFSHVSFRNQLLSVSTTSANTNINQESLNQLILKIPPIPEQTKVANFITAVDEKIAQLTQKGDLLARYKKGVMQQIFCQQLRFKDDDGRGFPEWEEKILGKVTDIIMGQSPDSKSYNDTAEGKPLIQGNADISNRKTSPRIWTRKPTKECKTNDIILTVRAPVGAVAKSYHNACIGRGVCAIRSNYESNVDFIYQLLLWFEPTKWVSLEQGSTFTAVNSSDIKTLIIPVPCVEEQTKIASFLTALDDKLSHNQTQFNAMKQYKQGLLQQMFV